MAKAKTRTVTRYVKQKRRHRRPKMTLPLGIVAPLGYTAGRRFYELIGGVPVDTLMDRTLYEYTGYSIEFQNWKLDRMRLGAAPLLAGFVAHKFAQKFGINRAIARVGIPYFRI